MAKAYGYHNHLVPTLAAPGNTAGTGSSATLASCKFYLPVRAILLGIYATATSATSVDTGAINVLAGSTKVTTSGITIVSGTLSGANTAILGNAQKHEAGTIFALCHNATNTKNIANLSVQLVFRTLKA